MKQLFSTAARRYRHARNLHWPHLRLLITALAIEGMIRCGFWLLPPRVVLRWVDRRAGAKAAGPEPAIGTVPVARLIWAVIIASRRVPRSTCLTRALAARWLLAGNGYDSELRLGVARSDEGIFEAHAWLVRDGQAILGGGGLEKYQPLPDLTPLLR